MIELKRGSYRNRHSTSFYPLYTFLLTSVICVYLYMKNFVRPFGVTSLLFSDLREQYAPFLVMEKNHLQSIDWGHWVSSMTYSSELGMGKNLMGTLGYYLLSPLNLLVFCFKNQDISIAVEIIVMIKLSLAAAFNCMFLEYRFRNHESNNKVRNKLPIVLGVIYAFSSYAIVFSFNIMWLDGYLLLPLLLYFIEVFVTNSHYRGIVVTMVLLFISNYYIAYMVGIFIFFYLVIRLLEDGKLLSQDKFGLRQIIKFVVLAFICALISAVFLLPAGLDTITNATPIIMQADGEQIFTFAATDILRQLFLGSEGSFSDLINNMPFIFTGIIVSLTTLLYFISKKFDARIKHIRGGALLSFFVCLFVSKFDIALQAFNTPNWFLHRYSFVIFPLLYVISYEVLIDIKQVSMRELKASSGVLLGLLLLVQSIPSVEFESKSMLYSICLILGYSLIFWILKIENWRKDLRSIPQLMSILLAGIMIGENALLNTGLIKQSFYTLVTNDEEFAEGIEDMMYFADEYNLHSDKGYRVERECVSGLEKMDTEPIGYHTALYNGTNGINLFNSLSNRRLHRFLKQFGYVVNFNYSVALYSFTMPTTDAFFALNHNITLEPYSMNKLLERKVLQSTAEDKRYENHGVTYYLYENSRVLPIAFPVNNQAMNFNFYSLETQTEDKNYFKFQEAWYHSMFPEVFNRSLFIPLEYSSIKGPVIIDGYVADDKQSIENSVALTPYTDKLGKEVVSEYLPNLINFLSYSSETPVRVSYEITMPCNGELYLNLSSAKVMNSCSVRVNGTEIIDMNSNYSVVTRLGYYAEDDKVNIELSAKQGVSLANINFAVFDNESFCEQFDQLDYSAVTVDTFSNGYVKLLVDTSELKTSDSTILTTVPFEDGWKLRIDGNEFPITSYQEALIAVSLSSAGVMDGNVHTVELTFVAPGLKLGAICSITGIVLLVIYGLVDTKRVRLPFLTKVMSSKTRKTDKK